MFVDINFLLSKFIKRSRLSGRMTEEEIKIVFKSVIADKFGRQHSTNIKPALLKDGILTVISLSSDFSQILTENEREIRHEVNKRVGREAIYKIDLLT